MVADSTVEHMPWLKFTDWFAKAWKPGEHVALIGPTGMGKTTLACGILPLRKYVLAIDPKGGDSTLASLKARGFVRSGWPIDRSHRKEIREGRPVRLIVGPVVESTKDIPKQKQVFAAALDGAFDEGGWTVYIDELQLMADRRMLGFTTSIERNLIAARDRGVSMVTSFQRPAYVPRSAADQSRWVFVWSTRDVDVVNRLAEMVGRPKAEIRGAIGSLERHSVLLFSQNPLDPIRVVRPPKV
jgi:energy-coupling factor transporter ATP-binding protein EcfA2